MVMMVMEVVVMMVVVMKVVVVAVVVLMMVVMTVAQVARWWWLDGDVAEGVCAQDDGDRCHIPCPSQACDTLVHQHKHQHTQVWKTTKRCYGLAG